MNLIKGRYTNRPNKTREMTTMNTYIISFTERTTGLRNQTAVTAENIKEAQELVELLLPDILIYAVDRIE